MTLDALVSCLSIMALCGVLGYFWGYNAGYKDGFEVRLYRVAERKK